MGQVEREWEEEKTQTRVRLLKAWEETIQRLVEKSQGVGGYPVKEDHCFKRILLDHICGGVWYEKISKPAKAHMSLEQLEGGIEAGRQMLENPERSWKWNRESLEWRREKQKKDKLTVDISASKNPVPKPPQNTPVT
jgi:hypothetical protein